MAESQGPLNSLLLGKLVQQWQAGDNDAFNQLLRKTQSRLETLARRMLRDYPVARGQADTFDILQTASVRLMRALQAVQPGSTRDFYRLAALQLRRELLDLARQCRRVPSVQPLQLAAPGESRASPDDPVDARDGELERWSAFHDAVGELPEEESEVMHLLFYHGFTHEEIASELTVSTKTVQRRLRAAMQMLSTRLGGEVLGL